MTNSIIIPARTRSLVLIGAPWLIAAGDHRRRDGEDAALRGAARKDLANQAG